MGTIESRRDIEFRRSLRSDESGILEVLAKTRRWPSDDRQAAFFRWKHEENAFGPSPAWVAVDGDLIVGFRTFLRWEFERERVAHRAVRAVDTATVPSHQGRGIFRRLTVLALEELRAEGVEFVFNTPNPRSAAGYLKMGWEEVGRPPVQVRPISFSGALRLPRARAAADRWSTECDAGVPAGDALAHKADVAALLATFPRSSRLRTRRSPEYLQWRYGFQPLHYRAILLTDSPADGLAVVRVRMRGPSSEAVVAEALVPGAEPSRERDLLRHVARSVRADHVVVLGRGALAAGYLPVPRAGPLLTWRGIAAQHRPPMEAWALTMGDIELF